MDQDDKQIISVSDHANAGSLARFIPGAVVSAAIIGFAILSWYAYHHKAQSVKEEDLLVVEADKTPMKEKPLDPGGMKFPHQDKTVFDTFSGTPQMTPKPERILPAPEEPMPMEADNSDTKTWVNENLHKKTENASPAMPEQVIGSEEKKPASVPVKIADVTETALPAKNPAVVNAEQMSVHSPLTAASVLPETKTAAVTPVNAVGNTIAAAPVTAPVVLEPPAHPQPDHRPAEPEAVILAEPVPAKAAKPAGGANVQLGAYRSEAEAKADWNKMQKKYSDLLGARRPVILRADLGAKGVYYRLRLLGFADSAAAKVFCGKLSAKGQACMLSSGKS